MGVLKARPMLVTFRVSVDEHEALADACLRCGARSIAEFVRAAALQRIRMLQAPEANLAGDLMTLSKGLLDLDSSLAEMQKRIRAVLGPVMKSERDEVTATSR